MPIKKTLPAKKTLHRGYFIVMYVVLVLIVIFSGLKLWLICYEFNKAIDKNTYQVVFLDNGESYFGKLKNVGFRMYQLQDVYYLKSFPKQQNTDQNSENTTATTENNYEVRLIRLGDQEFYKPANEMTISRDHVIYWENLQDNSEVMDFINSSSL